MAEFGLPKADAEALSAMLLSAIEGVLTLYRTRRAAPHAAFLEERYLDIILGSLDRIVEQMRSRVAAAR